MGYTHHWNMSPDGITTEEWGNFTEHVKHILVRVEASGIPLVGKHGQAGTIPEVTDEMVVFNGAQDEAYETFRMVRTPLWAGRTDMFCKTNHHPYDLAVCLVLIAAKVCFGDYISVTTDGTNLEWNEALRIAEEMFPGRVFEIDAGYLVEV